MITEKTFSVRINLARMAGVGVATLDGPDGKPVEGVFIPKGANFIYQGSKGGLYLTLRAYQMKAPRPTDDNMYMDTHVLKIQAPKDVYDTMSEEEKMSFQLIGIVSCYQGENNSNVVTYSSPAVDNPVEPTVVPPVNSGNMLNEDPELPF